MHLRAVVVAEVRRVRRAERLAYTSAMPSSATPSSGSEPVPTHSPGLGRVLRDSVREFLDDQALRLAAALSYYAVLSLAPLLLLLLAVGGFFVERKTAGSEIVSQMRALLGEQGAEIAQTVVENARQAGRNWGSILIGILILIVGASGVFAELQDSMNIIWNVKATPRKGVRGFLRKRVFSAGMLLATALLLLISLALSAGLAAFGDLLEQKLPGSAGFWRVVNIILPVIVSAGCSRCCSSTSRM